MLVWHPNFSWVIATTSYQIPLASPLPACFQFQKLFPLFLEVLQVSVNLLLEEEKQFEGIFWGECGRKGCDAWLLLEKICSVDTKMKK